MDLVKELAERLKRNNSVLLVAPTGWGKTTLMFRLAVQLAKEGWRVGILAPTLTLLVKKWPQLLEMLHREPNPLRVILTAGAGQYCVYRWNVPQRYCRLCRLYRRVALQLTQTAVTFEDIEKATPEDVCGYWAQEEMMTQYNIVLGHYGRLKRIVNYTHYLFIDEAHEFYLPHIISFPLYEVAELLGVSAEELGSVAVIKELIAEKLSRLDLDPITEDKLYTIMLELKKTCWIESGTIYCLDIYNLPRGVRVFATTATPPPGWPPEGWEKIEIKPQIRPRAFVEPETVFVYRQNYEGATLQLYLIVKWLREKFGVQTIAVFATSSLRQVLQYSLPPGVELFPAGG
jgi:hypothetical protein